MAGDTHLKWLRDLLGLVNPYLSKLVIDKGIINKDLKAFVILVLIGAGIFILNGAIDALKQFLDRYIKNKVNFDLMIKRLDAYKEQEQQAVESYQKHQCKLGLAK